MQGLGGTGRGKIDFDGFLVQIVFVLRFNKIKAGYKIKKGK